MVVIDYIGNVLLRSTLMLAALLGSIIIAGLILEVLKKVISRYIQLSIGWEGIILTGMLGTPIHELGHAIMCVIFRHKIRKIKLFPFGGEQTLGYVEHSYNSMSIYQRIGNFFIGIGPIISGTLSIMFLMWLILPDSYHSIMQTLKVYTWKEISDISVLEHIKDMAINLYNIMFVRSNMATYSFWIFLFLAICISSHMALSASDMKGAASGLVVIYVISIVVNFAFPLFQKNKEQFIDLMVMYNSYLIFALIISLFCSICAAIFSLILYLISSIFTYY